MDIKNKQRFSSLLAIALKARGVTQDEAARIIRIPPNTFRTKMARNTLTKHEAEAVMTAIKIPIPDPETTDFGSRWEVRVAAVEGQTLAQAIRAVDRQRRALDGHLDRLAACFPYLLRTMRDGDYSICSSSTVTSLEMERDADEELIRAVATAVANGGTFVYIRPDKDFLESFIEAWRFTRVTRFDEVELEVKLFRERLEAVLTKVNKVAPARAKKLVLEKVLQVYTGDSPFWAAGFCVGLLQTSELDGKVLRRATVRVPGPHRRALVQAADYDLFAARFSSFAIRALRESKKKTGDRASVDSNTVDRVLAALEKGGAYE